MPPVYGGVVTLSTTAASGHCTARYHGTESAYVRGCRCPSARDDLTRKRKHRRAGLLPPGKVPAGEVAELVRALMRAGFTADDIAQATPQVGPTTVLHLARGLRRMVLAGTAAALRDTYRELCQQEGPAGFRDATGTRRRLRAMARMGWPAPVLAAETGLAEETVRMIAAGRRRRVHTTTARAVCEVYDRLSMTPGPRPWVATWARNRGWHPPLAWDDDDLDDPTATPAQPEAPELERDDIDPMAVWRAAHGTLDPARLTPAERRAVVAALWPNPLLTVEIISRRSGLSPAAVRARADRAGWPARTGTGLLVPRRRLQGSST